MFTQPSPEKIASAYVGNPAPLARKVDQDKKQNGGIPKDLRQLIALNDIAEGKESAGIAQALQIPTNMPTVAQNTQQLAQQALQARMLQQVREQQRLQQKPPTLPLGTPQPKEQPQGIDALRTNVGEEYAEGGIVGYAEGGPTMLSDEELYQKTGSWEAAAAARDAQNNALNQYNWQQQATQNNVQAPTSVNPYDLDYFGNPKNTQATNTQAVDVQNLPFIPNNNAFNTPTVNPVDTEIFDYFTRNQDLVKNKDYNKIASDMYISGWTPEMAARATGTNVADFTREYDKTYGAFDRATQEDLVNQKYKKLLGLTDEQLGQRNFGAPMDTRENRRASTPFTLGYRDYQEEMAATGRRDAPAGTQFRTQAVFEPGALNGRGMIKLYDTATGQHLTNAGYGAYGLLDKFAVDPASYRKAVTQMYEASGKPEYMKDDYARSLGYKPRDTAAATNAYITKPLETATVADLRPKYEKDANARQTADSKINVFYEIPMTKLLTSKGLSENEAYGLLSQLRPVAGLVNFAEISRSKDPVKAMIGTLNYLQSKGVINLDPNTGPFSKIGQTRLDASGKRLPARYTGAESLRSLGLRGFASGGIASLDSNTLVGNAQRFQKGGVIGFDGTGSSQFVRDIAALPEAFDEMKQRVREEDAVKKAQDLRMAQRKQEALDARSKTSFFNYLFGSPEREKEGEAKLTELSTAPLNAPAKPEAVKATPLANIRSQLNLADASSRAQPGTPPPPRERPAAQTQTRVNAPEAPGIVAALPAEQSAGYKKLTEMMNLDPEAQERLAQEKFKQQVGSRDLSIYDRTAAELEARKQKLNAPKAGYDAMMEYLEQIALGGGRTSAESGSIGAARQRQLQKERLSQQDLLMDKILELGGKKAEAEYAQKEKMYQVGQERYKEVFKNAFDAAKSVNASDDEAKKIAAQAVENEKNRQAQIRSAQIGAQDRDNLMSRAKALMAADPSKKMTLEQAMQRAAEIGAAGQMESAEVRKLAAFTAAKKEIDANPRYIGMLLDKKNKPENAQLRAEYLAEVNSAKARYGVADQGLNALPTGAQGAGQVKFLGYEK